MRERSKVHQEYRLCKRLVQPEQTSARRPLALTATRTAPRLESTVEATAPRVVSGTFITNCSQCADGVGCTTALDCKSFNCSGSVCLAPTNCVAKVLDGQSSCALCPAVSGTPVVSKSKSYLVCYIVNECDPLTGVNSNGTDCASSSAVCGVNTIGGGNASQAAAIATYTCACST